MRVLAWLLTLAAFQHATAAESGQGVPGCTHAASAPIALQEGAARHTLLLFWAGADCNAAVAGRAVLGEDGHPIYMFIEDPNRIRIKEPGIEPHPDDFVPPLAEVLRQELARMSRTGTIGPFPEDENGIYPKVDPTDWERARSADRPLMCHSTGYSVQACLWLDPLSEDIVLLYEEGS